MGGIFAKNHAANFLAAGDEKEQRVDADRLADDTSIGKTVLIQPRENAPHFGFFYIIRTDEVIAL